MLVLLFPPSESFSRNVNTESRYGICCFVAVVFYSCLFISASALMTLPNVESDLLIKAVYFNALSLMWDWCTRSLPAKSTRLILEQTSIDVADPSLFTAVRRCTTCRVKMLCARLDTSFIRVELMCRFSLPYRITCNSSLILCTVTSVKPYTYTPSTGCWRTRSDVDDGVTRQWTRYL